MRLSIALAALAALALSSAATAAPRVSTFSLENGMDAVVIEDNRAPVVTHMVWYRAGAADEPPGKSGIAHLLEHMMFKGTDEIPEGAFSKIIAENGGREERWIVRSQPLGSGGWTPDFRAAISPSEACSIRSRARSNPPS